MLKQITLFFNTGFNSINFPADPQTLYLFENKEYPAMDLVQENFLTSIKIKATEEDIIDADYLRIGDAYYSIEGYAMTSTDVVSLAITQNAILSVGGIDKLEYITGEVYRTTAIDQLSTGFTDQTINDELLVYSERRPTKKIKLYSQEDGITQGVEYEKGWAGSAEAWKELHDTPYLLDIYSSVYDDTVPEKPSDIEVEELLGESGAAAWATIQSAWIDRRQFETFIGIQGMDMTHATDMYYELPAVSLYTGPWILNAASVMNGFGMTNFIIDSYIVPRDFLELVVSPEGHIERLIGGHNRARVDVGDRYSNLFDGPLVPQIKDEIMQLIANQVVEVTIESMATGDNNTVRLSDIDVQKRGSLNYIAIDMIADPSPGGCPYYKIFVKDRYDNVLSEGNAIDTLLGSIRGATWMNNPLLFERTGFAGDLASAKINQGLRRTMFDNSKEYDYAMYFNNLTGNIANAASFGMIKNYDAESNLLRAASDNRYDRMINGTANNVTEMRYRAQQRNSNAELTNSGLMFNSYLNIANSAISAGRDFHAIQSNQLLHHGNMQAEYAAEMMQLGLAHPGYEFDMRFPISDNTQLTLGNGILLSIKTISGRDLERYLRVLRQFGVPCTGKMDKKFVTKNNNEPYQYIQATGVTVKYEDREVVNRKINKQLLKAIGDMFSVGFRIWFEKPTDTAYKRLYKKEDQ